MSEDFDIDYDRLIDSPVLQSKPFLNEEPLVFSIPAKEDNTHSIPFEPKQILELPKPPNLLPS